MGVALGVLGVRTCFRLTFGEVFREQSGRDHRKLHRYAMEAEPVRLAIEHYQATHGHPPAELTDLPKPHPFPDDGRSFTTPDGKTWFYSSYTGAHSEYSLYLKLNWDGFLIFRSPFGKGWQYDPGNGDPAWLIDPGR